jgi:hypothetical protein
VLIDLRDPRFAEVLLGQDIDRHGRPAFGHLNVVELEDNCSVGIPYLRRATDEIDSGIGRFSFASEETLYFQEVPPVLLLSYPFHLGQITVL